MRFCPGFPFVAGTYLGTAPCSFATGSLSRTFNLPVTVIVTDSGPQQTYSASVSDFVGSFDLGAAGNLLLNIPSGRQLPVPFFQTFSAAIISFGGGMVLSPTPPPTPLPPSIILTLTGLAGIGLLIAGRKLRDLRSKLGVIC
jgi:hypothetical protein